MAWDSKTTSRRRQSSAASRTRDIAIHARNQSRQPAQPLSDHVADPFLSDFLTPSFDPASYLNSTLLPLQTPRSNPQPNSVPLSDLSIAAQSSLSQLSAHTTRLTTVLTQLTDDIIRSGSRLAYEVEVLRGETISLSETLSETLDESISKFIPGGVKPSLINPPETTNVITTRSRALSSLPPPPSIPPTAPAPEIPDPEYITQLRTLSLVRSRLSQTQTTFGQAMSFVFPPSETSVSSSFLSVSAPDSSTLSTEEKGQQVLKELRQEITELLDNKADPIKGIEDAAKRIEELKELCQVWKGTAEERGRQKFVEGLARMVEERHERLVRDMNNNGGGGNGQHKREESIGGNKSESVVRREEDKGDGGNDKGSGGQGASGGGGGGYGGYGLISQLQKLRGGI